MRLAIPLVGGRQWMGGYNYILNLFRVLRQFGSGCVEPVLFVDQYLPEPDLEPFAAIGYEIVRSRAFDPNRLTHTLLPRIVLGKDSHIDRTFRDLRIDAVFENANYYGWRLALPAIAWIPDFQHRYLPHMFSRAAYWKRELGLRLQVASGRTIMVSSEDARRSCELFFPSSVGRIHAVPFTVLVNDMALAVDPAPVRLRHGLPPRYVYLPNQYWKHKNHRLVIEALSFMRDSDVVVASTGHGSDPRHPRLYEELQALVKANGLENQFRFLGMVSYPEVIALMRGATAILNPSLFEGWSTTVEEARALGIPLLLSDLSVHREQMGSDAEYFPPDSPEALAALLRKYSSSGASSGTIDQRSPGASHRDRLQGFAQAFERLVVHAHP